jgi:hypothetical protein
LPSVLPHLSQSTISGNEPKAANGQSLGPLGRREGRHGGLPDRVDAYSMHLGRLELQWSRAA